MAQMGLIGKLFGKDDHTISLLNNIIDIQRPSRFATSRNFRGLPWIWTRRFPTWITGPQTCASGLKTR